ncbi:WhiB family transcriptional regulator [Catenulispora yoronensis]|uniref:WhiB family transcriptional regulator n=1 Tax=Catenulispora yoronensis TaxID=450799 RepID=UPI0031D01F2E
MPIETTGDPSAEDDLHWQRVLTEIVVALTPPLRDRACEVFAPDLFLSRRRQQAAFDGEAEIPADYLAARRVCVRCPASAACEQYARVSGDRQTFLAGMTASQRRGTWGKSWEITARRTLVSELARRGATTSTIAWLLERDVSLIRRDLRMMRAGSVAEDPAA